MDIALVIKTIATATVSSIINAVQRKRIVVEIKEKLRINSVQPPEKFDDVYAHALAEYCQKIKKDFDETQLALNLKFFDNQIIKKIFWETFTSVQTSDFNYEEWISLRNEAQKDRIDVLQVQEFHQAFVNIAKRSINPGKLITNVELQEHLNKSTEPVEQSIYPDEFKALIEEKTKVFCGRVFVFKEFDDFLKRHTKGYFTVIGDAGMGKSAIAAQLVLKYKAICYFNIRAEGRNTPDQFLQSIRQQLINRYHLQNAESDNLPTLLTKVNKKFADGETLLIVVDALDEVEQSGSGNLLNLPKNLPEKIYFLLTRRRYAESEKRLLIDEEEQLLDLTANKYRDSNRNDVIEYIKKCINDEPEGQSLKAWIQQRNIQQLYFVEQVTIKSENNFMYLSYVLPSIARGDYKDLKSLGELPEKLQGYYEQHWKQMDMDRKNAIILCVLVEVGKPISCESIARIARRDEFDVLALLNKWLEFLRKQQFLRKKQENQEDSHSKQKENQEYYYSIYHQSFADFLRNQPTLKREKKNNIDWPEVQLLISDYNDQLWKNLKSGKSENE